MQQLGITRFVPLLAALALASVVLGAHQDPRAADASPAEPKYLAFQLFTYSPDPRSAAMGEGENHARAGVPSKAVLAASIDDIKTRIGSAGDARTKLAVMLGPVSFDHTDAEVTTLITLGFELALEKDVAIGFHLDDSMFWAKRRDLWSVASNVEAMDWDGTPSTGRRLDWGKEPSPAPPQMSYNSPAIQREVTQRASLVGRAISEGVQRLAARKRPELFAGVIAGWETMIGQDFKTGEYLGYRALLNRGFTRDKPPQDIDQEREKIVVEFIELWTGALASAGVAPERIYSHTAFLSRRAFDAGDDPAITYMRKTKDAAYSQQNHFAPPWVAFGKNHRPGFSTYPQPGLFEEIYQQLGQHEQTGWASSEGTNIQPESKPGQTGMNMETYLAKVFNHGGTLVNIFSWGIGGEANKNMSFRVVTEGEEALTAYRKFLRGEPLIEGKSDGPTLQERLPRKIRRIQSELPAWIQRTGKQREATALMQQLDGHIKAKNFEEAEKAADAVLELIGGKP